MKDGLLPKCRIHDDVNTFEPTGVECEAEAISAGWPCQAPALGDVERAKFVSHCLPTPTATQGISSAGNQAGMSDKRSCLITQTFRILDRCPRV